ncbi:nuclear protein 96-domain-containing protein [Pseudomassariella vexata]|uniref:Nuclear protein 96-domain-containing protein n=1 Tax=Pseudomassariella vexata TaxID=1141098 RepID=A0A1Y2DTB4_9PEZI|nr:nuclear protein 96-domain-containing protein [Pseudomassariella vexata]ORY62513.1 nuclear protein 96-domain-containing protein [Pseudomassariella vexata]
MSFGGGFGFGQNNNTSNNTNPSGGFGGFGNTTNSNTNSGFGGNTTGAFGSTTNTGGGLFGGGGTSSGFGSNTTGGAFGTNTSTPSTFGATKPAFGGTSTGGGGLFGGASTTTAASGTGFGGFGANTTAASTSTPFGGGGGSSLFGGGASKPAFGAGTTTGTTGGGLFGGGTSTGTGFGGGAFNAPASTALGGPVGDPPGTATTAFQAFVEKESAASSAQNSFQNILFQEPYKKWSAEELRLADYNQGRRYGTGAGTGFGGGFGGGSFTQTNNQSSAFGSGTSSGGGLFGAASNTNAAPSAFGTNTNTSSGFGSGSGGLFGNKPATGGGLFGGSSTAQPAQSGTGLFGGSGTTTAFGSNTGTAQNAFGSTNTSGGGGLFGNNNTQAKSGTGFSFGPSTTNTNPGGFGAAATSTPSAFGTTNTGGGLFGNNNNAAGQTTGGGLFGNTTQQNTGSAFGGGGGFGTQVQQSSGGGLFGNAQQKPAGGLFGNASSTPGAGGGGLFGGQANNTQPSAFGQTSNNQTSGGLFGNKPAATSGGLFGNAGQNQTANTGGGLFGNLGQNQQTQQQQQPQAASGGLFGSLGQTQQKPAGGMFGTNPQSTGGGLFGSTNNQQSSLFGGSTQQQQQQPSTSSLFGNSLGNQGGPQVNSLTASVNDPSAYGTSSLFGNLPNQSNDPGPLATPLSSKKQTRKPSILPLYKLNPASASRFSTPQKRGFGFSYSTYGTPNSPSSVSSTPGGFSNSGLLTHGSLSRSLGKSMSSSNLRRSLNVEDSLLAPGAFSASSGSKFFGGNNVKKLVINKDLRSDLFSTPTKEKPLQETPNGSRKLNKRVSFDTSNVDAVENGDAQNDSANTTPSGDLGYIRPSRTNGMNGSKSRLSASSQEMEQVKGKELAIVHEEEVSAPVVPSTATGNGERELGEYWMSPTKDEIQSMNRVQRQKVSGFTVGRGNAGKVEFRVPVDLTSIDLDNLYDNIVLLELRSCTVYPNSAKKPPVGKGLNVPSLISLDNSWPRASKAKKSAPSLAKHIERLRRIEGTEFVNYDPNTGVWTFQVEHFTRYGLDYDEDDETEAPFAPKDDSSAASPVADGASDENDSFDFRHKRRSLPGAFDTNVAYDDEDEEEMAEVNGPRPYFLASRSAGSKSKALVPVEQDDMDEEYELSEEQDASASLRHHLAAEHDDSFNASQMDFVQETPGGIMRARMRAIKESATPVKVQIATGDDWMDMLQKTISPQKRDRALLKSLHEADTYGTMKDSVREKSPTKKRIVADGRGFATSIDLMKSIFDEAKAPAESPTSVRSKSVKFPYKRMTKNLDESEMDPQDRAWHNALRPTWGPNGTLVFSATPTEIPFGRSGQITEKNGLMTVMKGGIVSESQDIRFAKFSNEMSARALGQQMKLSQVYIDNGVPTVMGPRVSLKEFSAEAGSKNPAGEHEKLVWELASVLFDSIKIPVELQNDPEAVEKMRRESLSRFWEHMVEDETNKGVAMAGSSEEKALSSLAGHRVAEACKHLLDGKNFRLATLISLLGTSDQVKKDTREQMKEWQEANVLAEFSEPVRALYEMLSGNVCVCEGMKGSSENRIESFVISQTFGLNWKQAFGLRLWYAISTEDSISDAVQSFRDDVEQDKEMPPTTWFLENGIKGIWNDPDEDLREDLLWGLLQLYAKPHADLEAVLRPENSQLSPLDYRLSWQLGKALTATGKVSFGKNADEKADAATVSFAAQLTNEGSWQEAVFVLLHLNDPVARSKAIQDHLCRHAGLIGHEPADFKTLTEQFKIPSQWIWHAKALYMRSVKVDAAMEVQCLLRADSYAEAHRTFIKDVAPLAIIERNFDRLANLLRQFDGHQSQVPDWNLGGEVYKAFLQLMGHQRRHERPPQALVSGLLEGLPAMHGNTPEAGITEYAALTDMAAVVAKVVGDMAKRGEMDHQRILNLPLTEDVLLKHTRDLAWTHYTAVMAGH